jgi:hypothetical protein
VPSEFFARASFAAQLAYSAIKEKPLVLNMASIKTVEIFV